MRKQEQVATIMGIVLAVVGFVLIGAAWDGAAERDFVQGQFPYLLSGGLVGMGLIIVGVGIMVLQALRRDAAARSAELARLTRTVDDLVAILSPPDPFDPRVSGEYRPRPRTAVAGNGTTHPAPAAAEWQRSV